MKFDQQADARLRRYVQGESAMPRIDDIANILAEIERLRERLIVWESLAMTPGQIEDQQAENERLREREVALESERDDWEEQYATLEAENERLREALYEIALARKQS